MTMASALTIPTVVGGVGGDAGKTKRTVFGELAPISRQNLASQAADLVARLTKAAADRATRDLLFGPSGPLAAKTGDRDIAGMGGVVEGVNEPPQSERSADRGSSEATLGPVRTYTMSAVALAEQRALAAKYGVAASATKNGGNILASVDAGALAPANLTRAFDASEGTPLDPLLNTTYDLNYPKVVPSFK